MTLSLDLVTKYRFGYLDFCTKDLKVAQFINSNIKCNHQTYYLNWRNNFTYEKIRESNSKVLLFRGIYKVYF